MQIRRLIGFDPKGLFQEADKLWKTETEWQVIFIINFSINFPLKMPDLSYANVYCIMGWVHSRELFKFHLQLLLLPFLPIDNSNARDLDMLLDVSAKIIWNNCSLFFLNCLLFVWISTLARKGLQRKLRWFPHKKNIRTILRYFLK